MAPTPQTCTLTVPASTHGPSAWDGLGALEPGRPLGGLSWELWSLAQRFGVLGLGTPETGCPVLRRVCEWGLCSSIAQDL